MRRSEPLAAIVDEIASFQAEVHRLALALVREVMLRELDRRPRQLPLARPAKSTDEPKRRGRPRRATTERPAAQDASATAPPSQLELGLEGSAERAAAAAPLATTASRTMATPLDGKKRVSWTRESIVEELATWMKGKTQIDAPFMTRHGPPGLVAATRKLFGRFDAALNVAALHLSQQQADEPPKSDPT